MLLFYLLLVENNEKRDKFTELYERYNKLMYHVANGILNDHGLSEDAVQTAFLNIIKNFDQLEEIDCQQTKNFCVILVKNVSINIYRKRKKALTISFDDLENELFTDGSQELEKIISDLSFDELLLKVNMLSQDDADILTLRYAHDFSGKEIARLLNIKEDAVWKRLQRATHKLSTLLTENRS